MKKDIKYRLGIDIGGTFTDIALLGSDGSIETKKISSIGIRVRKWIAYHGFSVNIDNNLEYFNKIIPCGIKDKKVVRLKDISKIKYSVFLRELKKNLIKNLSVSNYS